ncbi:hypothetical protein [Oceanobacillus neutriphilus]|uniref:Uncharacterized protein n=1 Tax=Oceanobacillus neutriphilus TaxID=531815 RepID=A0ABQ2NYT0_9BACI|nr:hypothetical protein [Oceanobacillus neutriphilus]GGP13987.1 hypothetical protein GCM10011346_36160 [Oceanobacillus neutriphilus]
MAGILSVLCTILLVFNFWKNRKKLKETYSKLNYVQIIGVIISYLITIVIVFMLIYYAGNWLVSFIPFTFLRSAAFLVIVVVVLFSCLYLLNKALTKITNGIL